MIPIKNYLSVLAVVLCGVSAVDSYAGVIPVDLNNFFADPELTVAADGSSASFVESEFASFVRLTNDPLLGDPEVIVAMAGSSLTFDYSFNEAAVGGDDQFSAILFDSDVGILGGTLDSLVLTDTASGTASFDLAPYVGLTLGLEFELLELDPFFGSLDSTAEVSNLAIVMDQMDSGPSPMPEPGTFAMLGVGLVGLGFARRRKTAARQQAE